MDKEINGYSLREIFGRYLKAQSLPYTREREAIVGLMTKMDRHFTVEDLLKHVQHAEQKISRATIYRTINLLCNSGLIYKIERRDLPPLYELTTDQGHHDHMFCMNCGNIIEFYDESLEKTQEEICKRHQFSSSFHSLKIYGLCLECRGLKRA